MRVKNKTHDPPTHPLSFSSRAHMSSKAWGAAYSASEATHKELRAGREYVNTTKKKTGTTPSLCALERDLKRLCTGEGGEVYFSPPSPS